MKSLFSRRFLLYTVAICFSGVALFVSLHPNNPILVAHASATRAAYSLFPHLREKTLANLDMIQISGNEEDLEFWMRVLGPSVLMDQLQKDAYNPARRARDSSSEYRLGECHVEGHYIGRMAAKLLGINALVENFLDTRCAFGFYHGFVEATLGENGTDEAVRAFAHECESYVDNPLRRAFCQHAIGHSLAVHYVYDLPTVLEKCHEALSTERGAARCYHGAYMENIFNALGFGIAKYGTQWVDSERRDFPCTSHALPDYPYILEQCYFNQTALWTRPHTKFNEQLSIAGCLRAPESVRSMCFNGLGFIMAFPWSPGLKTEEVIQKCLNTPTNEYQEQCLLGALFMRSTHWGTLENLQDEKICRALGYEDVGICDTDARKKLSWIFEE